MQDHLGNRIVKGDFVSFAGSGNKSAEYGLITGVVTKVDEIGGRIQIERLDVDYRTSTVRRKKVYKDMGKFVKCLVVSRLFINNNWFNHDYEYTDRDFKIISKWLHKGILDYDV